MIAMIFKRRLFKAGLFVVSCSLTVPAVFSGLANGQGEDAADSGLYNPVADPAAVVRFGHARFTVLTEHLIRMEWSSEDHFEDSASLVFLNRRMPVPTFQQRIEAGSLTVQTKSLTLHYSPEASGNVGFSAANLSITLQLNGRPVTWHPGDSDAGNLMGTARTLDGIRGDRTTLEPGLVSRDGWVVVDDSTRPLFDSADFRFLNGEKSPWPWVKPRGAGEKQDWYFFGYGHEYRKALNDFVHVAGRIPLPPRFAFGAWWSRYWAYSDQELEALVDGFRKNDVPLDVLVIDMDWHPTFRTGEGQSLLDQSGEGKGWTGYSWNRVLFPDPPALMDDLHHKGLKLTLNLHPAAGVQPWEDAYPAMARAMGIDPATGKYVPFDITDKRFAKNYMDLLHHPLEKEGVDFWWLDWQNTEKTKIAGVNPTFWLNYVHFTDMEREGKRPLLFHRWGGLGNHRYQIGFSGDVISVWDSLRFQPYFTATAANVGYAYWSHDIGGHVPGAVEPELYLRWLQFGALSPILRTHTTKNPDAERRIWAYPEPFSDAMREAYRLRYDLLPYIYTEARRTYDTGVAFVHPLYFDWPELQEAYSHAGEYAFGDSLLADPITEPADAKSGLSRTKVWLPPGDWVEWKSGRHLHGPVEVNRAFDLSEIPLYVRAGAVIPMAPKMAYTSEKPLDPLLIRIFPGVPQQGAKYTLYEDAGDDRGYRLGNTAYTDIRATEVQGVLSVTIAASQGSYPGKPTSRGYELQLPFDWPPRRVTVDGVEVPFASKRAVGGWHFEGNSLMTVIPVARQSTSRTVSIRVERDEALVRRRLELNGFPGILARLRGANDLLRANFPLDGPSSELIAVLQTGDRLSYYPQSASEELARFAQDLRAVIAAASSQSSGLSAGELKRYRQQFGARWDTDELRLRVQQTNDHLRRAAAMLLDTQSNGQ
jgi:alpha-glucosidase